MTTKEVRIEDLAQWSEGNVVMTARGERVLRTAPPTRDFTSAWEANKQELRDQGLGWSRDPKTGLWTICWWQAVQPKPQNLAAVAASAAMDAQIDIPAPAGCEYLGFQKAGIAYALTRPATLVADEMGCGKTLQAIGVINAASDIKKVLIVCPVSLKLNWYRELKKWLVRPMTVGILEGKSCNTAADISIINFDILHRAPAVVEKTYDLVIVDESHKIKNGSTLRAKAVLKTKGKRRIAMTGTPILNGKPIELFTTLMWLDPAYWTGRKNYYATRYCNAHRGQFGWDDSGASHLEELNELLRSKWMVRRLKKDVLKDLPAKIRQVIEVEADQKIKATLAAEMSKWEKYEAAIDAAEAQVKQAGDNQEEYEQAVGKLKATRRVAFEETSLVRHATAVAKAPYVAEFVKETLGGIEGKVVLFAHHQDVIQTLMTELAEFNPVKVTGSVSPKDRDSAVTTFQNDSRCRLFIGNIQAAGVGLTLTASSHVIFAELDWTTANVTQAEDRCHRIGQRGSVLCQHIVLAGSLDAKMSRTIVHKQKIADEALDRKAELKQTTLQAPLNGHSVSVPSVVKVPVETVTSMVPQISMQKVEASHRAVRLLAGFCDGALSLDGAGFNKLDSGFGKKLALSPRLSQKQAACALRMAKTYKRQLPVELLEVLEISK